MESRQISAALGKLAALALVGSLGACDFEPDLPNIPWPTAPAQRFRGFSNEPGDDLESPEEGVQRLLGELFDPFNLPGDLPYEGSVYQKMDVILEGAYAHHGYDLEELAAKRQNNPLTEQMFHDYLVATNQLFVKDPQSGEEFDAFVWLQRRVGAAADGPIGSVLATIEGIDRTNPMNLEANYVSALLTKYPERVSIARNRYRERLDFYYGRDPAPIYEYLSDLDLFMGQQ